MAPPPEPDGGIHSIIFCSVIFLMGAMFGASPYGHAKIWNRTVLAALAIAVLSWVAYVVVCLLVPPLSELGKVAAGMDISAWELWAARPALNSLAPISGTASVPFTVRSALELGLFTHLAGSPMTPGDLARRANITEVGARCIVEVLALAGMLHKTPEGLFHHSWSNATLEYIRTNVQWLAVVEIPQLYHLSEAVRTGTAAGLHKVFGAQYASLYHARTERPELQAWTDYMDSSSKITLELLLGHLDSTLSGFRHLLDLCGSEGRNAIAMAKRYPKLLITVHDLPSVINDATSGTALKVRQAGLAGQISTFPWDLNTPGDIAWPRSDYDVVNLMHCINEWALAEIRARLQQVTRALRPGGLLLLTSIFPWAAGAPERDPFLRQVWNLMPYFLVGTQDGSSMHETEVLVAVAQEVGFVEVTRRHLGVGVSLIMGRKAA